MTPYRITDPPRDRPIPQHTRGKGACSLCCSIALPRCRACGKRSIHTIAAGTYFSERVCENKCEISASAIFRAEMKAALERVH